ncbi:MAG TPA: zinc ribbon domain-containing protein [Desulfobacteraceae bacterium]|nr:zinc ribbon domain-containing protein [Desulfobacteraceae bacterium]
MMKTVSVFDLLEEEHECPHCRSRLTLCHAPPIHVGDGLGWGSEYLFVCLNNECRLFVNGWKNIEDNYGHVGSYRYMKLPDSNESYNMMVAGKDAFTGCIVDPEAIRRADKRYLKEKEAVARLDSCVEENDLEPVLYLLLDDHVSLAVKKRAVALLEGLNDLACIEPLRNHNFRDSYLEQEINMALSAIMAAHYVKECPYCAELIKARAKLCKHCGKELA